MNICAFTGRLTADPELKTTNTGTSVCSFTLAVKKPHVKDATDFIDFVSWRQSAEYLCKYGHKGDVVEVFGTLQSRKWEDKNGNKRTSYEVVADTLSLILWRSNQQTTDSSTQDKNAKLDEFTSNLNAQDIEFEEIVADGDLPF